MRLSWGYMKQLIFMQPRALFHLLYHHTFDVRLKRIPVNYKHFNYLLIASVTDIDHNVDCIRHYEYNLESQSKIKLSNATGNYFLLLICRAQVLICDSQWVQWRLLINMIMNFWGPWKAGNFCTLSGSRSISRRTLLFAIGCEFAHYRV
jgi:hypothetical protein